MIPLPNLKRFSYKAIREPAYAFKVFIKRFNAYYNYQFGKGKSRYPEAITIFLTHRCNLRCQMCGQWGQEGVSKRQSMQYIRNELLLDEMKSLIDDVSVFKPNITLFGGEPLLYSDCLGLIKYIKQKNMHCLVITNGYMLEDIAEEIVGSGLDELNVSLDGNAQLHDRIRGMPGLFEKIMRGLKQINHFKTQKNKNKPFVNLQCTITQYNYLYLEQLIEVAAKAGVSSLTFHNLIFTHQKILEQQEIYNRLLNCNSSDWEGFVFEPGLEPDLLYGKMQKILSKKYGFGIDFYPRFSFQGLREYYQNPAYLPLEYPARCLSPWMVAYIFPDGEVRPCLNFSYSFGNIKNNKFLKIWNNRQAVSFRRLLKKNRIFPVCVRCSELYRY